MKSNKEKKKTPIQGQFSKRHFISEDDMIIQENKNYKEVNMTTALKKLLGFKPAKKKKNDYHKTTEKQEP